MSKQQPFPDQPHCLVRESTIRKLWKGLIAVLTVVTLMDFVIHPHPHFGIDGTFGFYSWYGLVTCILMVLVAKLLGVAIKRKDTYYD